MSRHVLYFGMEVCGACREFTPKWDAAINTKINQDSNTLGDEISCWKITFGPSKERDVFMSLELDPDVGKFTQIVRGVPYVVIVEDGFQTAQNADQLRQYIVAEYNGNREPEDIVAWIQSYTSDSRGDRSYTAQPQQQRFLPF